MIARLLTARTEYELLETRLKRGLLARIEQDIQEDWPWVDASRYCREYAKRKSEIDPVKYWNLRGIEGFLKEQCARLTSTNYDLLYHTNGKTYQLNIKQSLFITTVCFPYLHDHSTVYTQLSLSHLLISH